MSISHVGILTGNAPANFEAAGIAIRADEGPEFIWNQLEVSGPAERLYDFIGAASGPGFVDWRPEWHSVYEQIYFEAVRGGAPTREAAEKLARKLRDILWRRHEEERTRAEMDSHGVPLDLNALIPIPRRVLRKGFGEAGQKWMLGELGRALADPAGELRDRARTKKRHQGGWLRAGRGVPLPLRRLVTLDRASAHAQALAGIAVRDESGVFGDGCKRSRAES